MIKEFIKEYYYLSNYCHSPIEYDGIVYPTVEVAYEAQKTTDKKLQLTMSQCNNKTVKTISKKVQLRTDWNKVKTKIMKELLLIKFSDESFKQRLLSTDYQLLLYKNKWHDNFWGLCSCDKCVNVQSKNLLGEFLMELREKLRSKV